MTIQEATAFILERYQEISSPHYGAFCKKAKVRLDAPVIHVAGSNGKGSTCFYLTLIAAKKYGEKVGTLYNSFYGQANEAIRFGGKAIAEEEFLRHFEKGLPLFEKYGITGFEILVFIAYASFEEHGVDLAIVECGMGGTFDPTNIDHLNTRLSIITNVSLEHTEYLGTTPSEIAMNISGIIAKETPAIIGPMDENSEEALKQVCAKQKTALTKLERPYLPHIVNGSSFEFDYPPFKGVNIETTAFYQVLNASLALEAVKNCPELELGEAEVLDALRFGSLEGRFEKKGEVYLDAASNPAAIEALCRCLQSLGRGGDVHVLFACKGSANISVMLPLLDDAAKEVVLTTFGDEDARDEFGFALYTEDHRYIENPLMALMHLQMSHPGDPIVVTGCQAFISQMRSLL